MKRLLVRVFHDNYSLSLPAIGAVIMPINDIPNVSETLDTREPTIDNAEVCGVKEIEKYQVCIACNGKVYPIDNDSSSLGCCQKCNMKQKMSRCSEEKLVAKIIVTGYDDEAASLNTFVTLVGYGDILKAITETDATTLLNSKPFKVTYNPYFVITSISR